jgi:hypothetical protein
MKDWQKYAIDCFKKEEFYEFPKFIKNVDTDFERYSSYDRFVWDTLERCGCIATATLSMLFKPKLIVEMGVNLGWTSLLLCKLNPEARVLGVDISGRMQNGVFPYLPTGYAALMNNCQNYSLTIGNSYDLSIPENVDLCFIDACHFLPEVELDTRRAWENRNTKGDWCIAWDDYHENNPDVFNTVNKFVAEVNMPLQKIASWYFIGSKTVSESELENISLEEVNQK